MSDQIEKELKDGEETEIQPEAKKDDFAPSRKLYEKTRDDMLKYKAELAELKQARTDAEEEKLIEGKKWEELAKRANARSEELEKKYKDTLQQTIDHQKRSAVIQELGGLANEVFAKHIDVKNVEIADDGVIQDTVKFEAERIRKDMPQIVKSQGKTSPGAEKPGVGGEGQRRLTKLLNPHEGIGEEIMDMEVPTQAEFKKGLKAALAKAFESNRKQRLEDQF